MKIEVSVDAKEADGVKQENKMVQTSQQIFVNLELPQ